MVLIKNNRMKYLLSILYLFVLSCDSGDDEIHGCTDENAINFNANAMVDDGSCNVILGYWSRNTIIAAYGDNCSEI